MENINYDYDLERINNLVQNYRSTELVSDGYHTFKELYEFRKVYNAALFNEWAREWRNNRRLQAQGKLIGTVDWTTHDVHKSRKHHDGEYSFGDENWFIVSAMLPTGLISNHYHIDDWDLFKIPEVDKAKYEYDGHTSKDVLERLKSL